LAEADARRVADLEAAASTGAWAAQLTGSTAAVMRGGIWLAQRLRERYEHTRVAFATGKINEAQARVIVTAAERLPKQVTDTERAQAEENLVAKAVAGMNAKNLRRAAKRMLDKVRDDLSDRHEANETKREESEAETETWFGLWDSAITGQWHLLGKVRDPRAARPAARHHAGEALRTPAALPHQGRPTRGG
jgi:hypothetical protein